MLWAMSVAARRFSLAAVLAASLAFTAGAAADFVPSALEDKPLLYVTVEEHSLQLGVIVSQLVHRPGRVTVEIPRGFDLDAERRDGGPIGMAGLFAVDASNTAFGISMLDGEIVAEPPAGGLDPACARGTATAVWTARFQLLGDPIELPLVLRAPRGEESAEAGAVLELCAPLLASGRRVPVAGLVLLLTGIAQPEARGEYDWRANVEPLAADGRTFGSAYEVRANVPLPHRVRLSARYVRGTRTATVSGRVSAAGRARPGVLVTLTARDRVAVRGKVRYRTRTVGTRRADRDGRFTFRTGAGVDTSFQAYTEEQVRACRSASRAPLGCLSTTTVGVVSEPASPPLGRGKRGG
jgi:hypothetical protein